MLVIQPPLYLAINAVSGILHDMTAIYSESSTCDLGKTAKPIQNLYISGDVIKNGVSVSAVSSATFTVCILYQGTNNPVVISVFAQKHNNIVILQIPSFTITVSGDTTEILSSPLSYTNLQPLNNTNSSIFINNTPCSVKIKDNMLKIKPTAAFTAGVQEVDSFTLTYIANSTALTDGQWGGAAPTVVISVNPTTTLKKTDTATVTFTFSADPLGTFDLLDVSGTGAGLLSVLTGTGLTRTATFTPTDNNNLTTYVIDILPNKFSVIGLSNTNSATLSIVADTRLPSVSSLSPALNSSPNAVGDDLSITFDEQVSKGTAGQIRLFKSIGDTLYRTWLIATDPSITISGSTATISQPDMDNNIDYYVLIDAGTFTDLQGNAFSGILTKTEWAFIVGTTSTQLITPTNLTSDSSDPNFLTSSSSIHPFNGGLFPYRVFDSAFNTQWAPVPLGYNPDGTANAQDTFNTGAQIINGAWIKVALSGNKFFNYYELASILTAEAPTNFTLYGSLDNVNFTSIDSKIGYTFTNTGVLQRINLGSTATYRYIVLHITKVIGANQVVSIGEMRFGFQ